MTLLPADVSFVELARRQQLLDRVLIAEGAGHVVHDLPVRADGRVVSLQSRPWRVDPQPYVLEEAEFDWLAGVVTERMRAAEAILSDLHGERRLVAERVVEPAQLWATNRYRLAAVRGASPRRWLTRYAVDLARDVSGRWHALRDLTDSPTGLGYALLDRAAFAQAVGFPGDTRPRAIEPALVALRRAFADLTGEEGPRVVVFSGGIDHESYIEHSYLATKLGFNLVEAADLVVRQRTVWLRTLGGLERVDVVYRRLEDHRLDPMEVNAAPGAGVPGMLLATSAGRVVLANAHGSGVMEAEELASLWDDAAEVLTGQRPTLALRPPAAAPAGAVIDQLLDAPAERVPVWRDGAIVEHPMILRVHAVATDAGVTVMPGGNGRVLDPADDPRIPTPCIAKDVWVLGHDGPTVVTAGSFPQVDLIASVPTRAAESLFWLGRAAERAEAIARMARVVLSERDLEVGPLDAVAGRLVWAVADRGIVPFDTDSSGTSSAVAHAGDRCAAEVGAILAESASVREFLSSTAGRVLGQIADVRTDLHRGLHDVDTFDQLLVLLSAFSGLWSESVIRGPAWHFGDLARRLERAIVVLDTLGAGMLGVATGPPDDPFADGPGQMSAPTTVMELVLAGHDSLVAYRRRHRSDVVWSEVVASLVRDPRNPRSVAASLERIRRDADAIDWQPGIEALAAIEDRVDPATGTSVDFTAAAQEFRVLADRLTRDRLATPPDPTLVRTGADPLGMRP